MTETDIQALDGVDTSDLDERGVLALKYVEHLTLNKGELLEPELLDEMKRLYTDGEITKIEALQTMADGTNAVANVLFTVLFKLHIIKEPRLAPEMSKMAEEFLNGQVIDSPK